MLYVIIFRNFRRKPYKKDCKQLSICNPFYSKLLSKRIFLFCYYYVYRALANPKLLRGLTHSGFMFDDIICDFYCPLLNVIFHKNNPCINCFLQSMQGHFDVCLHFPFVLSEFPLYKPYKPTLPRHTSNPIAPTATNTNPIPAAFFLFSITTNCLLSMEFIE